MPTIIPPTITALPAAPDPTNRATFNTLAYPWSAALPAFGTQVSAVAINVKLNADDAASSATSAADQVALAATQAGLATTNGAAQVSLAAAQVSLAAAQVSLATTSATTASTQAGIATTRAGEAVVSANAAEASRVQASKMSLGGKAVPPTLDNQGAALTVGASYYDTTLGKWRVWSGSAWGEGITSIAGVASVNGMTGNVVGLFDVATHQTLTNKTFTSLRETRVAVAASNLDLATANLFTKTITGATTFTVSNVPAAGTSATVLLDITNGGSSVVTWWPNVKWALGAPPNLIPAGRDVLGFFTHDGGATWTGLMLGRDVR